MAISVCAKGGGGDRIGAHWPNSPFNQDLIQKINMNIFTTFNEVCVSYLHISKLAMDANGPFQAQRLYIHAASKKITNRNGNFPVWIWIIDIGLLI